MSEKPEALRLANAFETHAVIPPGFPKVAAIPCVVSRTELSQAAIELRRQHAEIERLREALDRSLTDEQIRQIAASIDRSMPLESAKILFARRIEAALRREDV
jgi:hypothetical protein